MAEQSILTKLNKPTYQIEMELIQDVMNTARGCIKTNKQDKDLWDKISEKFWKHLRSGFGKFDDQLFGATCFYTVIRLSNKLDYYINEVLKVIKEELTCSGSTDLPKTAFAVSIMHGLFQSSLLTQKGEEINDVDKLLGATFDLLLKMSYEYTQYTFIVFKTIRTFNKVCGTYLEEFIFNKSNQIRLLNSLNHNWENPITGIRDHIRSIFHTVLSTMHEEIYASVIEEINYFYWNKAKYLMLTEILEYSIKMPPQIMVKELVGGLIYSLHKPGLVSAGTDMYYAVLKTITSEQLWCDLFLDSIMQVLMKTSIKPIENFTNYWCLTTLKTFPKLMHIILDAIECSENMFSCLCIMKQGKKLGLLSDNHNKNLMVNIGLEDNNPKTRMLAFEIVCVRKGKMLPVATDYHLILEFIQNNINTDCTVLRVSMLGSLTNFFTRLHVLYLNNTRNDEDETILDLLDFCKTFQLLLKESIYLNGNYQRKITAVKLCNIFVTSLSEVHRKKKDQTRGVKKILIEILKDKHYFFLYEKEFFLQLLSLLKDPADDIRDNTMKLLINHYIYLIRDTTILNTLTENALECMQSKFFYLINCGQTMFKLISNVLLKNSIEDAKFKNVEDIFQFAYGELVKESKLQRNVMDTIENGKQMHSFISILFVVLETCKLNSMKLQHLDNVVHNLLDILVTVTKQFSWKEDKTTSSDFSKMNDIVQDIIIMSGYSDCDDQTKISSLHQIVLNCLWLNVKASCDLASLLIFCYTDKVEVCKKCLNLITNVLETCRHKGVIEAAGAALGRGIQSLTCAPDSEISELPMTLLKQKLDYMITDANEMSSITRRGAGLSIMVHKIVSSDMKKEKPLFHYFIKTLLKMCDKIDNVPIVMDEKDLKNETDLPKALYIHFLTRIVTDSSLASDMMYYSTELSMLAFRELTNPHWQIRNAALQLYGALVPKLVGQKKPSGTDDETIATVACDELRTHSPKLWTYIMEVLQNRECLDSLITHSNFVPILNMLANSAKRYNFSYDSGFDEKELLKSLVSLLGSPIFTVRRLTAKCIFNIYSNSDIFNTLLNLELMTENLIHGSLMLVEISYKYCSTQYQKYYDKLQEKFNAVFASGKHYYSSRIIFENVFCNDDIDVNDVGETFSEVNNNKQALGIFLWAHNRVRKYISTAPWEKIPPILKMILNQSDFEKYLECVDEKLELSDNIPETVCKEIYESMITFKNNKSSTLIWKILYKISSKFDFGPYIDVVKLINDLKGENLYKLRYKVPLIATTLLNAEEDIQIQFAKLVFSLSDPDKADFDMRHIAIEANNEIAHIFCNITDSVKVISIKTAIIFLLDEDDDLRSLSTHFYKNLNSTQITVHAYICLNKMLDPQFLVSIFDEPQPAIKKLCKDLDDLIKNNISCTDNEYNPFANDAVNIYLEGGVLKQFISKLNNINF